MTKADGDGDIVAGLTHTSPRVDGVPPASALRWSSNRIWLSVFSRRVALKCSSRTRRAIRRCSSCDRFAFRSAAVYQKTKSTGQSIHQSARFHCL